MTTVSDAFPSNFLKAADLNNRTVKVAIDKVVFEEIGQNKDRKPVVYFADVKKGLVLNKTNAEQIGAVHGQELEGWAGKEIELFSMMVPFNGQNVAAIRVRAVAEAAVTETPPARPTRSDFNDPLGI